MSNTDEVSVKVTGWKMYGVFIIILAWTFFGFIGFAQCILKLDLLKG